MANENGRVQSCIHDLLIQMHDGEDHLPRRKVFSEEHTHLTSDYYELYFIKTAWKRNKSLMIRRFLNLYFVSSNSYKHTHKSSLTSLKELDCARHKPPLDIKS